MGQDNINIQGKSFSGNTLPSEEVKKMSIDFKAKKAAQKITEYLHADSTLMLEDGRLIATFFGKNVIFSQDATSAIINEVDAGLFAPITKDFIIKIPVYIDTLANILDIESSYLNGTLMSIEIIDSTIYKLEKAHKLNEGRIFFPLFAYCGEVMRQLTAGEWVIEQKTLEEIKAVELEKQMLGNMIRHNEGKYNIFIHSKNGEKYDPYGLIQRELIRGFKKYSLLSKIKSELGIID